MNRDDWNRLQSVLHPDDRNSETIRIEERHQLHELSKESVAGWTDTIAGLRQQKLEAKAIREQKEEERKVQIDIEEARYQAQKRKEAIQRARTLQYAQTDRAKTLQGAVVLTDVLREREMQVGIKQMREEALAAQEEALHQYTLQQLEEDARIKAEVEKQERARAMELAHAQVAQATVHRSQRIHRRESDLAEQRRIDERAQAAAREAAQRQQQQRDAAAALLQELQQQKRDKAAVRDLQQQYDAEDEAKRREYAAAKERLAQMKYEKEMERLQLADQSRGVVVDKLAASMERREEREEALRRRITEEKDAAAARAEEEKQRRVQASIKEIKSHHAAERQRLTDIRRQEHELYLQERAANEAADRAFAEAEKQRTLQQRTGRKVVEEVCLDQAAYRAAQRDQELEQGCADREALQRASEMEEMIFREHAAKQIEAARARGCTNVYPLQAAVAGPPTSRPAPMGATASKPGRGNPFPGNSQLRMGFTWKHD